MQNKTLKQLILSGLFISLGVLLPIIFHLFGGGSVLLPMHIPVLLCGFFLSMPFAAAVGLLTPLLSTLLTGMPPLFPVLPMMMTELAIYALSISLLNRKLNLNVHLSLVLSIVIGRIAAGASVWVLATFFAAQYPQPITFITGSLVKGMPGIIIQLVLIPIICNALNQARLIESKAV